MEADAETGLSAAQAQERLDGGWGNAPVESPGASVREILSLIHILLNNLKNYCLQAKEKYKNLDGLLVSWKIMINLEQSINLS